MLHESASTLEHYIWGNLNACPWAMVTNNFGSRTNYVFYSFGVRAVSFNHTWQGEEIPLQSQVDASGWGCGVWGKEKWWAPFCGYAVTHLTLLLWRVNEVNARNWQYYQNTLCTQIGQQILLLSESPFDVVCLFKQYEQVRDLPVGFSLLLHKEKLPSMFPAL